MREQYGYISYFRLCRECGTQREGVVSSSAALGTIVTFVLTVFPLPRTSTPCGSPHGVMCCGERFPGNWISPPYIRSNFKVCRTSWSWRGKKKNKKNYFTGSELRVSASGYIRPHIDSAFPPVLIKFLPWPEKKKKKNLCSLSAILHFHRGSNGLRRRTNPPRTRD